MEKENQLRPEKQYVSQLPGVQGEELQVESLAPPPVQFAADPLPPEGPGDPSSFAPVRPYVLPSDRAEATLQRQPTPGSAEEEPPVSPEPISEAPIPAPPVATPPAASPPPASTPPASEPPTAAPPTAAPPVAAPPVAAPAPPAPIPAPQTPTTQNPNSGTDWAGIWNEHGLNISRSVLEVTRLIPGYGLFGGLAADGINIYQDFTSAPVGLDTPVTTAMLSVRSLVLVINNGVGHLSYINQLIQDGATVSVVFIEFTPVTATVNELLKLVKVYLDGCQFLLDFTLSCQGIYHGSKYPPGSGEAQQWGSFATNFLANAMGDMVQGVFDVIDLASGGFTNSEAIKNAVTAGRNIFTLAPYIKGAIKAVLQGWFNVWGGSGLEKVLGGDSAPAQRFPDVNLASAEALAEAGAFQLIQMELGQIKTAYDTGSFLIDGAGMLIQEQIDQMYQLATVLLDGKDPFTVIRDAATSGLDEMRNNIDQITQMQFFAMNGQEKAAAVESTATEILSTLDQLVLPNVQIPEAEIGDGLLADAGEAILNAGGSVANAGIRSLIGQIQAAVDLAKSGIRVPVQAAKDNATELGAFLQVVDEEASALIPVLTEKIAEFTEKLGQTQSFEEVVELLVNQVLEAAGINGTFEVDQIREGWTQLGTEIDAAIVWADTRYQAAMARASSPASSGDPGQFSLAPTPPGDDDEGSDQPPVPPYLR